MALYKNFSDITESNDPIFDVPVFPGQQVPRSGIYRCEICRHEVAANEGTTMTTQNHSQHPPGKGLIVWKLIVATER